MKSKRFSGLAKIWVSAVLVTCGAAFNSSGLQTENSKTPVFAPGKHFERVLIIVLENQDYASAMKNEFFAKLASRGTSFSNFKNLYHPSYPNYLAMIAGSSFGMHSDHQITLPDDAEHRTIADLLDWTGYAENYPNHVQPYLAGSEGKYARKHVPFLSFEKIQKESYRNVVRWTRKIHIMRSSRPSKCSEKTRRNSRCLDICSIAQTLTTMDTIPSITPGRDCKKVRAGWK